MFQTFRSKPFVALAWELFLYSLVPKVWARPLPSSGTQTNAHSILDSIASSESLLYHCYSLPAGAYSLHCKFSALAKWILPPQGPERHHHPSPVNGQNLSQSSSDISKHTHTHTNLGMMFEEEFWKAWLSSLCVTSGFSYLVF